MAARANLRIDQGASFSTEVQLQELSKELLQLVHQLLHKL